MRSKEAITKGHPGVAQAQYSRRVNTLAVQPGCDYYTKPLKPFFFDYFNMRYLLLSDAMAQWAIFRVVFISNGFWAWFTWLFVHIFYLIGFRNKLVSNEQLGLSLLYLSAVTTALS